MFSPKGAMAAGLSCAVTEKALCSATRLNARQSRRRVTSSKAVEAVVSTSSSTTSRVRSATSSGRAEATRPHERSAARSIARTRTQGTSSVEFLRLRASSSARGRPGSGRPCVFNSVSHVGDATAPRKQPERRVHSLIGESGVRSHLHARSKFLLSRSPRQWPDTQHEQWRAIVVSPGYYEPHKTRSPNSLRMVCVPSGARGRVAFSVVGEVP